MSIKYLIFKIALFDPSNERVPDEVLHLNTGCFSPSKLESEFSTSAPKPSVLVLGKTCK